MPGSRGELKWLDSSATTLSVPAAGGLTLLNGCAPGTGPSQRIGRRIKMKSCIIRMTAAADAAGAVVFQGRVKFWLIVDTQSNALAATFADVFSGTALQLANAVANLDNRDRFKVLWKRSVPLGQGGDSTQAQIEANVPLRVMTTYNAGTAGTIADIQTNALYLCAAYAQGGNTAAPTNPPRFSYTLRVRYSDD